MDYRFEDSPGLKHGCAICGTPLNHPRAKNTCYGKHAEPCPRFHHTMFRIGRASSCEACKMSSEQRHKRHSTIAALIDDIHAKSGLKTGAMNLEEIANAIYGCSESSIQDNPQAFEEAMLKSLEMLDLVKKTPDKNQECPLKNTEVRQILGRLGIDDNVSSKSKKQDPTLLRLVYVIINDIEIVANEATETLKRQLGFYLWADKRAYSAMVQRLGSVILEELMSEKKQRPEKIPLKKIKTSRSGALLKLLSRTKGSSPRTPGFVRL